MARLGLRIVELRTARALTQEQLAELLGFSVRQMQRVEAGMANIALDTLAEIAAALRCSVPDLFAPPLRATRRRAGRPGAAAAESAAPRERGSLSGRANSTKRNKSR